MPESTGSPTPSTSTEKPEVLPPKARRTGVPARATSTTTTTPPGRGTTPSPSDDTDKRLAYTVSVDSLFRLLLAFLVSLFSSRLLEKVSGGCRELQDWLDASKVLESLNGWPRRSLL